ncbi:MAG: PilZ domain-containing protein [Myxococcota bacterium]
MSENKAETPVCDLELSEVSKLAVRRHRRAKLDLYVNKIVGDEPHMARVKDISSSGLYLYKLIEPENLPSRVALELQLPETEDEDVIWAVGEVVREECDTAGDGVGIRFLSIAESDRERIVRFVEEAQGDN